VRGEETTVVIDSGFRAKAADDADDFHVWR